ncbi:MAG: chemotaxis protein CheA [Deltaproteobacteria bacterium]|nr:chemotaxis protein CheA [Deltaproteobacteria bacterium]
MADQTLQEIEAALEEMALAVMVINRDDLPAFGEILAQIEKVAAGLQEIEDDSLGQICQGLQVGLEKAILEDLDQAEDFFELLPEAVSIMQELVRSKLNKGQAGQAPEGFIDQLLGLAGLTSEAGQDQTEVQAEPKEAGGLSPDLDVGLAKDFIGESLDLLQEIEVAILAVEKDPQDIEAINAIFRPFHTIKGVSGFLNLSDINKFAHNIENLLDEARSGQFLLEGPLVDVVLDAVDLLRVMITDLSTQIDTGQVKDQDYGLEDFLGRVGQVREAALRGEVGDANAPLGQIMLAQGELNQEGLDRGLSVQEETKKPLGSVLVKEKIAQPKAVARALRDQRTAKTQVQAVKVDTSKLDNMVDAVGELVIALSLVAENPKVAALRDQKLERDMGQLGRITSELQKTAMSLRMVPIKQTFQRMSRVVRDLSRKSGKPAELSMEGQDTEIDRTMVNAIYDPMVHMVRNSMDHGLESSQERQASGKRAMGQVTLRAYHQGGKIVIEIEDDGRGLDPDNILAKGIEKGLVSPDAKLSESEIYNLILQPGFSTAAQITDISGRGVGMDVVRETVEGLRGDLEITSKPGQGSKFTIRLPLTMAIIEGMIVSVVSERYIIPALSVKEILKPEPGAFSTVSGGSGEMVMVRGRLLPLIRLNKLFGSAGSEGNLNQGIVVVVESEGRRKAVMVDNLLGKQEVVIKALGGAMGHLKGISGGAILGDGRVGLILDISGLFHIAENETQYQMPSAAVNQSQDDGPEAELPLQAEPESEPASGG